MARVVPSQVVEAIDRLFPEARIEIEEHNVYALDANVIIHLKSILKLVEEIPSELIVLKPQQYVEFVASPIAIRQVIQSWERDPAGTLGFGFVPGLGPFTPIAIIRRALAVCPDEFPPDRTTGLEFISDVSFRESLQRDIKAVNTALTNGEWKAATVIAGSVIEALLLWCLQKRDPADILQIRNQLFANRVLQYKPSANLEEWTLHPLIETAAQLKAIKSETATLARLTQHYRNLIHPGRSARLGEQCNRGTALSAVAALEQVVNDLTPN